MITKLKKILSNSEVKKYGANTAWLLSEKVLRIIVGLFIGVWITRYLGPEKFGALSYAQSFVFLFSAIATLGLDGIVIRELVKDETKRDRLIGTCFYLKLIGATVAVLTIGAVTLLTSNDKITTALILIISSSLIFQSLNVIDFYFQSQVLSRYIVFANILGLVLSSIIKVLLITLEAPLIAFAWVILFDTFILAGGFIYFYIHNNLTIKNWKFDWIIAKSLLKDSWPLMLSGIVVSVYMKIDQVMIKEMLDTEAVGQYAAAVTLSEAWYFIPMVVCSSLFPAIISAKRHSEELYMKSMQQLYDMMVWGAIAIALPMTFLSSWLVEFLYGGQYSQASSVLVIHVWAGIFVSLGVASGKWLLTENLQFFSAINTTIGAIINVALNYILIKTIGIKGAAWSTLISYSVAAYISLVFFSKTRANFMKITKSLLFLRCLNVKKCT